MKDYYMIRCPFCDTVIQGKIPDYTCHSCFKTFANYQADPLLFYEFDPSQKESIVNLVKEFNFNLIPFDQASTLQSANQNLSSSDSFIFNKSILQDARQMFSGSLNNSEFALYYDEGIKEHPTIFISLQLATNNLPNLRVRPKSVLDSFTSLFSKPGIQFSNSPEFSKSYLVKSNNHEATLRFFTPSLQAFLLKNPCITFEITKEQKLFLSVYHIGRPYSDNNWIVDEMRKLIETTLALQSLI